MRLSHTFKSIAAFVVILFWGWELIAVPAYPRPIRVEQPDGTTMTVRLYGDERFHYATTTDGYNLVSENGMLCYARLQGAQLVSTGVLAHDPMNRTNEERRLLSSVAMGKPYGVAAATVAANTGRGVAFGASPVSEEELLRRTTASALNSGEEFRSLVILVSFSDQDFTISNPQEAFDRMLNSEGYSENNAEGSARDYYMQNSNGKFNPHFDVVGPFKLSQSVAYYPGREDQFIVDACNLAQANGVDFSTYVVDGQLRDVFIFYSGYNAAETGLNYLWPARMFFTDPNQSFGRWGGGVLKAAAYTSELKGNSGTVMAGIGTFCHEFGHILGWPDFYDTDYDENGTGFNLDVFSLMASGSYVKGGRVPPALSAYERYMVGWTVLTEITEEGEYTLGPVYEDKCYMIKSMNEGEIFVFEYRNGALSVWDRYLQTGDPDSSYAIVGSGSGMLVYHIDKSENRVGGVRASDLWSLYSNRVNAYGDHECMRFVMASKVSRNNGVLNNFGKMFFPGTENVTEFTAGYEPYFVGWDGFTTGFELYNIKENAATNVTFEVKKVVSGTIRDLVVTPGQFDVTVSFVSPFNDNYTVVCEEKGGEPRSVTTVERTIHFTGLKPETTYTVSIYYEDEKEPLDVQEVTTESLDLTKMPTLGLEDTYKANEAIVLNYRNISSAISSEKWSINGEEQDGTVVKLAAGNNYRIMVEITTDEGVEYLVKYVNVL